MGVIYIYIYIPTTSGAVKFSLEVETQVILVVSSNLGRFQELLIERVCLRRLLLESILGDALARALADFRRIRT